MLVRIVRPAGTVEGNVTQLGDVVDLTDATAALLIANREAVPADDVAVETATVEPTETATARRKPTARKGKG